MLECSRPNLHAMAVCENTADNTLPHLQTMSGGAVKGSLNSKGEVAAQARAGAGRAGRTLGSRALCPPEMWLTVQDGIIAGCSHLECGWASTPSRLGITVLLPRAVHAAPSASPDFR